LEAVVVLVRDVGREYLVHARVQGVEGPVDLVVRHRRGVAPVRGEHLLISVNPALAHVFDAATGRRLPD
jgi:multiple sugar transport system ATP-binding protein